MFHFFVGVQGWGHRWCWVLTEPPVEQLADPTASSPIIQPKKVFDVDDEGAVTQAVRAIVVVLAVVLREQSIAARGVPREFRDVRLG